LPRDPIVLIVIKIRRHMARIRFFRRCFERPKMTAVPFCSLHNVYVSQVFCHVLDGFDDVREHRQIRRDQFRPGRAFHIGAGKNMRDLGQLAELGYTVGAIQQIGRDVAIIARQIRLAPGDANDIPIGKVE
jgi:hypothetical protein